MKLTLLEWIGLGLAAVLAVVVAVQGVRIHGLRKTEATLRETVADYTAANRSNQVAIAALRRANAKWAAGCRYDPAAGLAQLTALQAENARLADELAQSRATREVIYVRDPSARAWRDAAVPAAVADQLFPQRPRPD